MFDLNNRRFAGMAGLAFVVLWLVALLVFLPSGLPNSGDPAAKVLSYATDHRGALLTSAFLQGLGAVPFLVFLTALVGMMRRAEGEHGGWSTMTAIGGAIGTALVLVSVGLAAILVYRAADGDAGLARTLLDGNTIMGAMAGFPIAVFVLGASQGMAAGDMVGRWIAPLGMAVAALQLAGAAALAKGDGFFSPQGTFGYIVAISFLVWMVAVAGSLVREHAPARAAHPPATPAPA